MQLDSPSNSSFCLSVFTTDAIHSTDHGQLTLFRQRLYNCIEKCILSNNGIIEHNDPSSYCGIFKTASDAVFAALQIKRKSKYNITNVNKEISDIEQIIYEKYEFDMSPGFDQWITKFLTGNLLITTTIKNAFNKENKNLRLDLDNIKILRNKDLQILESIHRNLSENYQKTNFDVIALCYNLKTPYLRIYSFISRLMQVSPSSIIRDFRLLKALKLLEQGTLEINEISDKVGFNSPSYFTKSFKYRFGILPSRMRNY